MVANVSFSPYPTVNAGGSFSSLSHGYTVGTTLDNPAARFQLDRGILNTSETLPMWGGVGIYQNVPTVGSTLSSNPSSSLGSVVGRATNVTANTAASLAGFSVFDQNYAAVQSPQSPVPQTATGGLVTYYRLGSRARLAVQIDPGLVSFEGSIISPQFSWDFTNQQITTYSAAYAANVITGATWASTNGGQVTFTTTSAHGVSVGSDFTISGMVPAGYNGVFTAITGTTGSTLVAALAVNPGIETTYGTLVAGGGALAVKILDIQIGNCLVPSYNLTTGALTWNRNGNAAVIEI
jgi:hypothetical protein